VIWSQLAEVVVVTVTRIDVYRVHHYVVRKQEDGRVNLEGGKKKFPGPVELIAYHRKNKAGLVTKLTIPCARPPFMFPYFWFGVTIQEFNDACLTEVRRGLFQSMILGDE